MSKEMLSTEERSLLLKLAREAIEHGVAGKPLPTLVFNSLPEKLQEHGASFVTLTIQGQLRGCIGTLEPYQPLIDDVREHAVAAALHDYRFSAVSSKEIDQIKIEVSCLTLPKPIKYQDADDLIKKLRPGIDGVVLRDGPRRATFLPQVWEKIPEPRNFLDHLCYKMGVPRDTWMKKHLDVLVYQVEEFQES